MGNEARGQGVMFMLMACGDVELSLAIPYTGAKLYANGVASAKAKILAKQTFEKKRKYEIRPGTATLRIRARSNDEEVSTSHRVTVEAVR